MLMDAVDNFSSAEYEAMVNQLSLAKSEYEQLEKDSDFLAALQAVGVDNWEGYSEAFEYLRHE